MSMTKVIEIDGKQVAFKASAAIPRIYRVRYGRDIFKDLIKLDKELKENSEEDSGLTMCSLEAFENIAYLMAKHADSSIPDTAEEWLEEFSVFSIYQVLPEIISLWGVNLETQSEAKKTACHRPADDDAALPAPLCAAWDLHPGSRPAHSGARQ